MALRTPLTLAAKRASSTVPATAIFSKYSLQWRRGNATVAPAATGAAGSKGPTAIVFMNMGGPSTTDEVHAFLSALFVSMAIYRVGTRKLTGAGRQRSHSPRTTTKLHWPLHCAEADAKDSEAVCRDWWGIAHQEMV